MSTASSSYVTSQPGGSSCVPVLQPLQQVEDLPVARGQAEQRLRLEQEHAMVADVVDDGEPLLAWRPPKTAAELLKPEDLRLRGPQHHDGVERRQIDAFVEHVHGKDDVELAPLKLLERQRPWRGRRAGVHGHGAEASRREEGRHEIGVALRDAEAERSRGRLLSELLERILRSSLGRDRRRQRLLVESRAPPRNVRVVHIVWHAEVVKRREQLSANALDQIAAIDEILLAEREQIAAVAPLGRRREAQQELRVEVGDQLPVGRGGGVVELVDDDVVERVGSEPLQMLAPAERLDRGKQDVGVRLLPLARVVAKAAPGGCGGTWRAPG